MSLNVQEGDLHSTVLMIAEMGGLNVMVDDSVKGAITISIEDVEPREALEIVAMTKDLQVVEKNGVLIVTSQYGYNALMDTYVFLIRYGNAESLREVIVKSLDLRKTDEDANERRTIRNADGSREEYTVRGNRTEQRNIDERVVVDKETNAIILYGTAPEYERAKKILDELDVPLKQVSIEARILAIDKSATKDLGVDWFWSAIPQNSSVRSDQMDKSEAHGIFQFGRAASGVQHEWYYGAQISALLTKGKAKMLSKPNILTVQGHEATINVGSSVPVPTTISTDARWLSSYEYRDAGIILRVTPRVNADGSITATIHTEVSTPQYISDVGAYQFNNRSADTTVTMQDGEPIVIGGLIGADEERSIRKIPFLGDLPLLGSLFKSVRRNKSDSELVIFLTAHVIEDR